MANPRRWLARLKWFGKVNANSEAKREVCTLATPNVESLWSVPIEPGKRPRSSMSPTIVLQVGAPSLVIGSPGGSRIIGYVTQAIVAHLDWGMDVQQAVSMPHLVNRFGTYDLEDGTDAVNLEAALTEIGFEVNVRGLNSGLHAIQVSDGLSGGADPRREGIALGE